MILVTVGTTKFPFIRLLRGVDEALCELGTTESLIVQSGETHYTFHYRNIKQYTEIPFAEFTSLFHTARCVISHGGAGTILLILQLNQHKPLIIPRTNRFGEHVNDHQVRFAHYLKDETFVKTIFPDDDIVDLIRMYVRRPPRSVYTSHVAEKKKLITNLTAYTESLTHS